MLLLRLRSPRWGLQLLRRGPSPRALLPVAPRPAARSLSSAPPAEFSEADFHRHADALLSSIELRATPLEDAGIGGFDITSAQGVLTLRLGQKGTYVLNKQTPNRQVWWSSPLSGPRRYAWSAAAGGWLNTRDGSCLLRTLRDELRGLTGVDLPFTEPI
jgi:frataxin